MAESVRDTAPIIPATRADNPPPDRANIKTILTMLVLVVLLVLFWEGAKSFSKSNGYKLAVGGSTIDLSIFNDTKLPHLPDIVQAFVLPAQRNGPPLYQTLINYNLFTLGEALLGFGIGALMGFLLAVVFAHSSLMQKGVLPYVIASQTIPILALAPMVASAASVAA